MIGDHRRRNESRQLDPIMAVGRAHHGYLNALVAQSSDAPCPLPFNHGLAFELEAELPKEVDRRCEVLNDNAYVVHPAKSHVSVLHAMCSFCEAGATPAMPIPGDLAGCRRPRGEERTPGHPGGSFHEQRGEVWAGGAARADRVAWMGLVALYGVLGLGELDDEPARRGGN